MHWNWCKPRLIPGWINQSPIDADRKPPQGAPDANKKPSEEGVRWCRTPEKGYLPAITSSFLALITWPSRAASLAERPKATSIIWL